MGSEQWATWVQKTVVSVTGLYREQRHDDLFTCNGGGDGDMDTFDDLASFGSEGIMMSPSMDGDDHDAGSPSSPRLMMTDGHGRLLAARYDPIGLTIGQTSPGGRSFSSDRSIYGRNQSHAVNAVHMHIQENAKIPNYNRAVDRSNNLNSGMAGGRGSHNTTDSNPGSSEIRSLLPGSGEFSMAELFLSKESSYRKSLAQSYEKLGSLPPETGFDGQHRLSGEGEARLRGDLPSRMGNSGRNDDELQLEMDALTAAIDPTPWSEIQRKMHIEGEKLRMRTAPNPSHQKATTPIAEIHKHPHHSSYYPYGRHHQLPIPGKPPSPPSRPVAASTGPPPSLDTGCSADNDVGTTSPVLALAIATAAAIVATNSAEATDVDQTQLSGTTTPATQPPLTAISAPPTLPPTSTPPSIESETMPSSSKMQQNEMSSNQLPPKNPAAASSANQPRVTTGIPRPYYHSRTSAPAPLHAAAHTTSRASVLAAANRQSQYGFGGNHTVPSVPAPPPISMVSRPKTINPPTSRDKALRNGIATSATTSKSNKLTTTKPHNMPDLPTLTTTGSHSDSNDPDHNIHSRTAYERKKQRAKDARVKLNEAIERLSVAMSLAGSESKLRISQLQSSESSFTEGRAKSIQVNEDCIRLAEQAKKWDRPSFVDTAASLIQTLNAECEALMAELSTMQRILDATQDTTTRNQRADTTNIAPLKASITPVVQSTSSASEAKINGCATSLTSGTNPTVQVVSASGGVENGETYIGHCLVSNPPGRKCATTTHQENKRHEQADNSGPSRQSPSKRPRVERMQAQTEDPPHDGVLANDENVIYGGVAKMLDPVSLCRCPRVSKHWSQMRAFEHDEVWLTLSVKRFGYYNVRQWTERFEDGEPGSRKVASKIVYREMNAANVMPHFIHDGVSLLGDARIPGRISGWVFVVERSNGETLRSVKREPGSTPAVGGAYQSRPVVELRIVIQNTGMAGQAVILKNQLIAVDVSTRRSGGELREITWDDRFEKVVRNLDGTIRKIETNKGSASRGETYGDLCRLDLFETVVFEVHINARGCSTISKFQQRSNFTKLLVSLDGTTVPMVIPFLRDHSIH